MRNRSPSLGMDECPSNVVLRVRFMDVFAKVDHAGEGDRITARCCDSRFALLWGIKSSSECG